MIENHMKICVTEADFLEKFFNPRIGKIDRNWVKNRVFWIYWKILSLIFTKFVNNRSVYYFLCFCTSAIFEKIFVPEIWAKMFWVNQIVGFFYQLYLQNKSMKSIRLSCRLSGCFLGITSLGFLNFVLVVETLIKLFLTEPDFLENFFVPKIGEMGQKVGF